MILANLSQVHFYPVSGIWELRISRLGEEDGGEYGCQVLLIVEVDVVTSKTTGNISIKCLFEGVGGHSCSDLSHSHLKNVIPFEN